MAKKSKGFSQLLKQQHSQAHEQQALEKLGQQVKEGPWKDNPPKLVVNPKGEIKMSEVLETFIEPFLDSAKTHHRREALFATGIAAWNMALMPESERPTLINQLLEEDFKSGDPAAQEAMREIFDILIARKEELFADNHRYILSFTLEDRGNTFFLSVASTLVPPPQADEATD